MAENKTRGIRNNNPFNIRYSFANKWIGQIGSDAQGFVQFSDLFFGLRAGFKLIENYIKMGYNTPRKIIERFAPPSENDTSKYLNFLCHHAPIFEDMEIKPKSIGFYFLCSGICYYESRYDLLVKDIQLL